MNKFIIPAAGVTALAGLVMLVAGVLYKNKKKY